MDFRSYASSSAGNLYSVHDGDETLLIEAGLSIRDIRRHLGFELSSCLGCLITHGHGDHARSVHEVMRAGVDVYATEASWNHLSPVHPGHRAVVVEARQVVKVGRWRILPFDTRHDIDGSVGYLIEDGNRDRLLFAIDTAFVPYTFAGLTHIAIECNYSLKTIRESRMEAVQVARVLKYHMGLERVVKLLQANDLSRVREIHLLHLSDGHGDSEAFSRAVARETGVPVYVAEK